MKEQRHGYADRQSKEGNMNGGKEGRKLREKKKER